MAKQAEGSLQERIQRLLKSKGSYCIKNWGNMTKEPGIPDIIACYKGYYLALEVKLNYNKPSTRQGIHCRNIKKAGGITNIVYSTKDVLNILLVIDNIINRFGYVEPKVIQDKLIELGFDDGSKW